MINGKASVDDLRYVLYSAHDTQVVPMVVFMKPDNFEIQEIPYASSFNMEFYYDEDCLNTKKDYSCFTVRTLYNNLEMKFNACRND